MLLCGNFVKRRLPAETNCFFPRLCPTTRVPNRASHLLLFSMCSALLFIFLSQAMLSIFIKTFLLVHLFYINTLFAQSQSAVLDVLSYQVQLEPTIPKGSIKGNVSIEFITTKAVDRVSFDCGNLTVTQVRGESGKSFHQKNKN